jgi:hypothetical protein
VVGTTLVAGLIGLIGTLVGGVLTIWTTRLTTDRYHQRAREELQRQEYRSAVIRFSTALGAYRTAEMDRWHARHGGWRDEASTSADVYRMRTAAWDAFYELDLSTSSRDLVSQAQRAIDWAGSIQHPDPDTKDEMNRRADQVREELAQLIAIARTGERTHPPATMPDPIKDKSLPCTVSLGICEIWP